MYGKFNCASLEYYSVGRIQKMRKLFSNRITILVGEKMPINNVI